MPVTYVLIAAIAALAWKMPGLAIAAASIQGLFITFDILMIRIGAVMLLSTLAYCCCDFAEG